MHDNVEIKVVLKQTFLHGSEFLQRVATVYINRDELRVYAPPEAKGESNAWTSHFTVHRLVDLNSEEDVGGAVGALAIRVVKEKLEKQKSRESKVQGVHPDGLHCDAQICLNGHVQHCDGMPFNSKTHCTQCGAAWIDECPHCLEPIRGVQLYQPAIGYVRPGFCHGCGHAYPWTEAAMEKVSQLIDESELNDTEKQEAKTDLDSILKNKPGAESAAHRTHGRIVKMGGLLYAAYVDYVVPLVAETVAKVIKGG
jgi:hypothetical protein